MWNAHALVLVIVHACICRVTKYVVLGRSFGHNLDILVSPSHLEGERPSWLISHIQLWMLKALSYWFGLDGICKVKWAKTKYTVQSTQVDT